MLRSLGSCLLLALPLLAQSNFPPPVAPANNPVTPDKVLLGMALFFDEQMSSTGTVACATCHDLTRGGVDARAGSSRGPGPDGILGNGDDIHGSRGISLLFNTGEPFGHHEAGFGPQITPRRAPSVINSGYHTKLGYEGSKSSLEHLIAVPLMNMVEMAKVGRTWAQLSQKITAAQPLLFASNLPQRLQTFVAGRTYPDLFQIAFGSPMISRQSIVDAIASYLRTLNSDQSRWDLHLNGQVQLTPQEQQGLTLFTNPAAGATSCHTCHGDFEQRVQNEGPMVGQMTMTSTGPYGALTPTRLLFHNVGIRPNIEDPGRQNVTASPADAGKFRVASLRNVELTAPYFHNGSAATLHEVVDFYDRGGNFHTNQAAQMLVRGYTPAEKDALVAILRTLTDPRVQAGTFPFDQPTLGSRSGKFVSTLGRSMITASGPLVAGAPYAPRLGEDNFCITLSGVTQGTSTFLMWDLAHAQQPGPYNVSLAMTWAFRWYGMGQASWLLSMPGTGVVVAPMPLPNDPTLHNLTLYSQWLVLEPAGNSPVATSNTLRIPLQ